VSSASPPPFTLPPDEPYRLGSTTEASPTRARWRADGWNWVPWPARLAGPDAPAPVPAVVHSTAEDACIGEVFFESLSASGVLRLALWIAPPFRERGHATALGRLLVRQAFEAGFRRLEGVHAMATPGAGTLAERLGFLPEGVQRAAVLAPDGSPVDLAHWGLLKSDR
jgi:RimJ/RimL family protein N-acetyltransferase